MNNSTHICYLILIWGGVIFCVPIVLVWLTNLTIAWRARKKIDGVRSDGEGVEFFNVSSAARLFFVR